MTKQIKNNNIIVCGLGNHARKNIIPAILKSKALNLYGVCTRNNNVLVATSEEYQCLAFSDFNEILNDKNIDIVYLSTPPGLHYEQGMKALNSGKHLWIEKPLTIDIRETTQLIKLASESNLSLCEGIMYIYHPHFYELKQYLSKNLLGKVGQISSKFGLPKMNQPGFRFVKGQGASCLYDVGIYPISLILSLFPDEEIVIEESHLVFDKSTGTDVSGSSSLLIDSSIHCNLDWGYNTSYRNEVDVWGEKSSLFTKKIFSKDKDYMPTFIVSNSNGEISEIKIEKSNHFLSMLNFFSKTITDEKFAKEQRSQISRLAECLSRINGIG
jgi:predicted dehydrogenase